MHACSWIGTILVPQTSQNGSNGWSNGYHVRVHAARWPLLVYDACLRCVCFEHVENGGYGTIASNKRGYRPWIHDFWHKLMLRCIGLEGTIREGWRSKCDKKLSWAHPCQRMWPHRGRLVPMHPTCQAAVFHPMLGWKMTSYIPWWRTYFPVR